MMLSALRSTCYLVDRMNYLQTATRPLSSWYAVNELVLSKDLRITRGTKLSVQ